jgi:ParB family chromosome partitioning protein
MKRKVLGRGLGALIPEEEPADSQPNEIDIDLIDPNPYQPRFRIDEKTIEELAASIKEHGVLQPVLVRPLGGRFQLIAGERRLSAAQRVGLLRIPARIRDVPEDRVLELALVENIQREQLNPVEEAQAYQKLLEVLRMTQEELAGRLGRERSTVANSLRLLKLPPQVRQMIAEGSLTPGHARALLAADVAVPEMIRIAGQMVSRGWSVRDAERWAKSTTRPKKAEKTPDPNEHAALDRLRFLFGTKVEIISDAKGAGQIRIHFYDQDDLIRLFSLLTEKRQ